MLEVKQKLKDEIRKREDEIIKDGYHQTVLNIMYQHWQRDDVKMDYREILEWFEKEYGELARFAVQIGKYNQQVTNGGHLQYYHNNYCGDSSNEELDISLHQELVVMMKQSELDDAISLKVFAILQEFTIELDNERYVEEEVVDEDGNIEYEEYENMDYLEVINHSMLSEFDKEYYKVCDSFMELLEEYVKNKIEG